MRVIVQYVNEAKVEINGGVNGKINKGYVLLVGFTHSDTIETVKKMVEKIINLRIIYDENDKMNLSIKDINGSILSISQFTLYSKLNGRRPSFSDAMKFNEASDLYEKFNEILKDNNINVQTGIFGADMKVSLVNDGPCTITIDSSVDF